jgi:chromosome segregation protein
MLSIRRGEALPGVLGRVDEIAEVSDAFTRTEARRVHHGFRRPAERISAVAEQRDAVDAQAKCHDAASAAALAQAEKLRSERDLVTSENQHVVAEAAQLEASALKEASAASRLVTTETETSALLSKRLAELDAQRKIVDGVRAETTAQATALARLEEQLKSLDAETASAEKALAANDAAVKRASAEISRSEIAVQEASAAGETSRAQVATLIASADAIRQETVRLANDRSRLDTAREERAARRKTIDKDISALRDEMERLRVRENALTLTRASLIQDVLEQYSRDLGELAAQAVKPVTAPTQEEEEHLAQLKRQMANLGPVNVAAIEEEDELRERSTFLKTEIKDLETARTRLFEAIDKLDTFCRDKFMDSLNKVGVNFQEIFRKLFQGGDVKLRLLEGDILEAGLEVTVHPPGKEPRVLSLLSGGEKAMTAIAMIMAAFKASPSPFCLLDEVDGPLDEANVERLNLIVQEFAVNTQFAVITHNKLTMTYADIIYGIAMEEPGVSKYIKTDLVRAAENLAVAD